jgi:type II secretory pathway pseudopilin PulG
LEVPVFIAQDMLVEAAALLVVLVVVAASLAVAATVVRDWLERQRLHRSRAASRRRVFQDYEAMCSIPLPTPSRVGVRYRCDESPRMTGEPAFSRTVRAESSAAAAGGP